MEITFPATSGKESTSLFRIYCCFSVAQSCPALCDFMKVARQAPLSMGFPRQEYWNRLPFPSSGDLPDAGIESESPALVSGFFNTEPPGKPSYSEWRAGIVFYVD